MWHGAYHSVHWTTALIRNWALYFLWLSLVVFGPRWNVAYLMQHFFKIFGIELKGLWIDHDFPKLLQYIILALTPFFIWLFARGFNGWLALVKATQSLRHLGLKTPTGIEPKVARVIDMENGQRRIMIHAVGLDIETFRQKKGSIESSFNAIVQDLRVCPSNRQMVELLLSDKELPKMIRFDDHATLLSEPYSFLVGQTTDGFITANLRSIHHLLVAGATGGGKSVFFKQALVGLLQSSKYLQLYLVDLKRGVELKPFAVLKNVEIAKDEDSAIALLQVIVTEMERRFKILEEKGYNEIQPERDNLDRIVIAIDEASVLFTIGKTSKSGKERALSARELTDQIAKLGRAAGIHLILATQKVVKETIDTRVQTNINAKMCFRVNTIASSMTVIGNKKAAELPDVKGRGIWSLGSNDLVVQVPKLDDDEIQDEIQILTEKFNTEANPLRQPMLQVMSPKNSKSRALLVRGNKSSIEINAEGALESN